MHLGRGFRIEISHLRAQFGVMCKSTLLALVPAIIAIRVTLEGVRRVARSEKNVAAVRNLLEENP